jgi:hypothetical protein
LDGDFESKFLLDTDFSILGLGRGLGFRLRVDVVL